MKILHGMSVHSPAINAVMDQVYTYSLINQTSFIYLEIKQSISKVPNKNNEGPVDNAIIILTLLNLIHPQLLVKFNAVLLNDYYLA